MPDDAQKVDNSKLRMSSAGKASLRKREDPTISKTIYMTVRGKKGPKKVIARGLIGRRAEESAPFRAPSN